MFVNLKSELKEKRRVRRMKAETPWYTETWDNTDLENALNEAGAEVNEENIIALREICSHIFDDLSDRIERLTDMARTLL